MLGRYLQFTNTAPVIRLFAWDLTTGAAVTSLTHSNTALTTTRGLTDTTHALVTATLGTWVSNGFVHRGHGVYDWYCPVTVNASGVDSVDVRASTLPAGAAVTPFTVALGPDNLAAVSLTNESVAGAVRTNLTTELGRIDAPVSGALTPAAFTPAIATLRQQLGVGAKFGGPVAGGTATAVPVYDPGNSAVLLGTVTIYRDASGNPTGQSELTPP